MKAHDTFRELQAAHFVRDWHKIQDEARREGQSSEFHYVVMRATDSFWETSGNNSDNSVQTKL